MTKMVRIENADTSSYKVLAQTQSKNAAGEWVDDGPPKLLGHPAAQAELWIHGSKRIIVYEEH